MTLKSVFLAFTLLLVNPIQTNSTSINIYLCIQLLKTSSLANSDYDSINQQILHSIDSNNAVISLYLLEENSFLEKCKNKIENSANGNSVDFSDRKIVLLFTDFSIEEITSPVSVHDLFPFNRFNLLIYTVDLLPKIIEHLNGVYDEEVNQFFGDVKRTFYEIFLNEVCIEKTQSVDGGVVAACIIEDYVKKCSFHCYLMLRSMTGELFCDSDGRWHNTAKCVYECAEKQHFIENGVTVTCPKTTDNKDCAFSCNPGFIKKGTIHCVAYKGWQVTAECYKGCQTLPPIIPHGSTDGNICKDKRIGYICDHRCDIGYDKEGKIECSEEGWIGNAECVKKCKSPPPSIEHVKYDGCTGITVGKSCNFCCRKDYIKEGKGYVKCVSPEIDSDHGDWEVQANCVKGCKGIDPNTRFIPNGYNQVCSDTVEGGQCDIVCNEKYFSNGHLLCKNAMWVLTGQCEEGCKEAPSKVLNGAFLKPCGNIPNNERCQVMCNSGYVAKGEILCENSEWKENLTCEKGCSLYPFQILNGAITDCRDSFVGESCKFRCDAMYVPKGDILCNMNGWLFSASCLKGCPDSPPAVLHSTMENCYNLTVGQTCDIECGVGLVLDSKLICTDNGWSDPPKCVEGCKNPPNKVNNAKGIESCVNISSDDKCPFTCLKNYIIHGTIVCEGTTWNSDAYCAPASNDMCVTKPVALPNSNLTSYSLCQKEIPGAVCNLKCLPDYKLLGSLVCDKKIWTGDAECVYINLLCLYKPTISHAIEESLDNCQDIRKGGQCFYRCQKKFHKAGEDPLCNGENNWDVSKSFCTQHQLIDKSTVQVSQMVMLMLTTLSSVTLFFIVYKRVTLADFMAYELEEIEDLIEANNEDTSDTIVHRLETL